ncbi:hypothetical protein ABII15_02255 [Streptomyces sp. HUAS MG91]|uniref:Secreted protein n=1 Tax=Streptomyces tabacisoli TaxID=3156398 RepID=A0AAU8ILX0_9ACTN
MRRTVPLSTATAALLLLGAPVCAAAPSDGDDGWSDTPAWTAPPEEPAEPVTEPATEAGAATGLVLDPADVRPGASVLASTTACGGDSSATGDADSVGAGEFTLRSAEYEKGVSGSFEVPSGARPGTYPVSVTCEGGTVARQTLTVSGEGGTQLHGVHAGDGGSLGQWSTLQLALGGALIAGSVGAAGYYAVRRRAEEL